MSLAANMLYTVANFCAISLLLRIAGPGYFKSKENRDALKGDPEFETLRSRSEFQKLLVELPAD